MACSNAVTHCIVNCDRGFPSERLQNYLSESGYGFECILPNHRQVFQRMTFCYYAMYLMLEKLKSLCVTGVMMTYLWLRILKYCPTLQTIQAGNPWATPGEASSTSQLSWESITDDAVCMFGFNFGSLQTARNRAQKFMIDFSDIDRLKKPACRDYHNCDYYANDNIVNLLLDTVHASHETRTSVIPLSSFAFEKFVSEDCKHTATKNLLREVNRRQACGKSLFVPINNRNHWCAASISNLNGRTQVRIYNSLQQAWAIPKLNHSIFVYGTAAWIRCKQFTSVILQV